MVCTGRPVPDLSLILRDLTCSMVILLTIHRIVCYEVRILRINRLPDVSSDLSWGTCDLVESQFAHQTTRGAEPESTKLVVAITYRLRKHLTAVAVD